MTPIAISESCTPGRSNQAEQVCGVEARLEYAHMQILKVGRYLPSGLGVKRASTHYNNIVALHSGNRDGVVSMDSQVETV